MITETVSALAANERTVNPMTEYIVRETCYPLATKQEVIGEIVRCKDCKWHGESYCNNFNVIGFRDADYCSLGRRKEKRCLTKSMQ